MGHQEKQEWNSPIEFMVAGWMCLWGMSGDLTFDAWRRSIPRSSPMRPPSQEELEWLWESMRSSPWVRAGLGRLPPASARWAEPIQVLPPGSELWCSIGTPSRPAIAAMRVSPTYARVKLIAALRLASGKGRFLQAADVDCEVTLAATAPADAEAEARALSLEPTRVHRDGDLLRIRAKSLNHAYTLASRRVEQRRRSSGGRVYDRMFWWNGTQWLSLDQIRSLAMSGEWICP